MTDNPTPGSAATQEDGDMTTSEVLTVWAVGENDHGGTIYCLHATEEAARECLARTRTYPTDDVWPVDVWPDVEHG